MIAITVINILVNTLILLVCSFQSLIMGCKNCRKKVKTFQDERFLQKHPQYVPSEEVEPIRDFVKSRFDDDCQDVQLDGIAHSLGNDGYLH